MNTTDRKAIILADGSGTRLHPITPGVSRQMLPIYNKPLIFYPLSVLMLAGMCETLIISTLEDLTAFRKLLGYGSQYGIRLTYAEQPSPDGLAKAFIISEEFIGIDPCWLILGDNIFYGQHFSDNLCAASEQNEDATVFGYQVNDSERFGVVEFDAGDRALSIEQKPAKPKSSYAVTGLHFIRQTSRRDRQEHQTIRTWKTGNHRREMRIFEQKSLTVHVLGRGCAWLDTSTFKSLLGANRFVSTIEQHQGWKVACLEEIGYANGRITAEQVASQAEKLKKTGYASTCENY